MDTKQSIYSCHNQTSHLDNSHVVLTIPDDVEPLYITGVADAWLKLIEHYFEASINVFGNEIELKGDCLEVDQLVKLFLFMFTHANESFTADDLMRVIDTVRLHTSANDIQSKPILITNKQRIQPKTAGQKTYINAIHKNTITICTGPAGTGKTYLAMAYAIAALQLHEINRIILTRPIIEAGESLGFLPGTLEEKIDPYLRPLYDALYDMCDSETCTRYFEEGLIEIAPLAYMRGRTFNNSVVILDEAQNTTTNQMKMFLTRLGFNSKFIITGDISQRDLGIQESSLQTLEKILVNIQDIAFIKLSNKDIIRNSLVGRIVEAYERYERI